MSNQSRLDRIAHVLLAKGILTRAQLRALLDNKTGTEPVEGIGPVLAPILDYYAYKASDKEWVEAFPDLPLEAVTGWEME